MAYILAVIFLVVICAIYRLTSKVDNRNSISFMETFNLTEMPIVTLLAGNSKVNFLLDTGSSQSYISSKASELVTGKEVACNMSVISAQGTENMTCRVIETTLAYKDKEYGIKLFVNKSLDTSFKDLKTQKGVTLHGILGSDFLDKYSYIMDFKKYIAYSTK